jgi:cytosolic 5'-nucleotidase 3
MDNNVIIPNQEKLEVTKRKMMADGPEKLHVVSDFDKTLTSCFVNGKKIVSLISILRDEHYLSPDYSAKAQALYDKYHPIEINPNISLAEKEKAMHEWWITHYDLLIKSGLSKKDLESVAKSNKVSFRAGAMEFFDFLHVHNIPLLILSSAGVGAETISSYLENYHKLYKNIYIVSNTFIWDDNDYVIGVKEPIIHTFNKDYTSAKHFPFYNELAKRKNVILLGDGISDVNMMNGFEYDNLIKIGFLNENSKGELAEFKKNYDIIILNDGTMDYVLESFKKSFDAIILDDGPMDFVNNILEELINKKIENCLRK